MFLRPQRKEQGQSIALMAAAIVGMMVILGLAVDGGNLYLQRRNAQNAADAAAQAGTIALMENYVAGGGMTEGELYDIMYEYGVERNPTSTKTGDFRAFWGYQGKPILEGSTAVINHKDARWRTVRARPVIRADSYFAQLFGRTSYDVNAPATAGFGPSYREQKPVGVGIDPILVSRDWLEGLVDYKGGKVTGTPTPRYPTDGTQNDPKDPTKVDSKYIFNLWDGDKGTTGFTEKDVVGANRGWATLSCVNNRTPQDTGGLHNPCQNGARILTDWIAAGGYKGDVQRLDEVQGKNGVANTLTKAVEDRMQLAQSKGEIPYLILPVFDKAYTQTGQTYYRIVDFAKFRITGVVDGGSKKAISGYFVHYIVPGGIDPNQGDVITGPIGMEIVD